MSNNERSIKNLQLIILFSVQFYAVASRSVSVPIDGSYSIMYSSPLLIGSNSTNLLKVDFTKPPECITTSKMKDSWIIVDLGFVFSGLVQLRLSADHFNQKAHEHLSNVRIEMAQKLPLKFLSNFSEQYNSYFEFCGGTGTVSKDTFNVVIDCKSVFNARWILLRKNGQLNLCHIHIYQNAVDPHCFVPFVATNLTTSNAKSKFVAFKFVKHLKSLECFEKCKSESTCEAISFVLTSSKTGICQLLKVRNSYIKFICDEKCQIFINLCHLGQKQEVGVANEDGTIELQEVKDNSFALSLELDGDISCHEADCGETGLFISDSDKKITSCGHIDPLLYRVLVNNPFLCQEPVKNPKEIIIKTKSNSTSYKYRFKSINLRTVENHSFVLDILKNLKQTRTSAMLTRSTGISSLITRRKIIKSYTSLKTTKILSLKSQTPKHSILTDVGNLSFNPSSKLSTQSSSSMKPTVLFFTESTSITSMPSEINQGSVFPTKKNAITASSVNGNDSIKMSNLARNPQSPIARTTISTQKYTSEYSINDKSKSETTKALLFTSGTLQFTNNSNELLSDSLSMHQATAPYIWIILVIFIIILITVTFIVILITVLESRRKRKEWDIPPNGLFPLRNQGSEPITMQSSLQESLFRRCN